MYKKWFSVCCQRTAVTNRGLILILKKHFFLEFLLLTEAIQLLKVKYNTAGEM